MIKPKTKATKAHAAGVGGAVGAAVAVFINSHFNLYLSEGELIGLTSGLTAITAWLSAFVPENKEK